MFENSQMITNIGRNTSGSTNQIEGIYI